MTIEAASNMVWDHLSKGSNRGEATEAFSEAVLAVVIAWKPALIYDIMLQR